MSADKFSIVVIDLDAPLQLSPIELTKEYAKEMNENKSDFVCLSRGGELVRPTLYRVGGMGCPKIGEDRYFLLLKYTEAEHDKEFLKKINSSKYITKKEPAKHLKSQWCILDRAGNEIKIFDQFDRPYLVKNSCLYSYKDYYYNILTDEKIVRSARSISSKDFIFVPNDFDDDKSKRGVMQIRKSDGAIILFPE